MLRSFSYAAYAVVFAHTATSKWEFERLGTLECACGASGRVRPISRPTGAMQNSSVLPAAAARQRALLEYSTCWTKRSTS